MFHTPSLLMVSAVAVAVVATPLATLAAVAVKSPAVAVAVAVARLEPRQSHLFQAKPTILSLAPAVLLEQKRLKARSLALAR